MDQEEKIKILRTKFEVDGDIVGIREMAQSLFQGDNPNSVETIVRTLIKEGQDPEKSFTSRLRVYIMSTKGRLLSSDVDREFGMSTRLEKQARWVALKRLTKEGLLVPTGNRAGEFKIVPPVIEVDKSKVEGTELSVGLPFGLEDYVRIFPGDLIVLAGLSNVGKTALMLNLAWKNKIHDCWYFSSEMGAVKCKDTISGFHEESDFAAWPFRFVDDFEDYESIIRPDAFNFIDYLEESEGKYFEIPSIERAIQRRLNKGIAFVAIQKQPGREYGIGGYNTIGKTALYINMDGGYPDTTITIKKAKTPRAGSVFNFKLTFQIDRGINLTSNDRWAREE